MFSEIFYWVLNVSILASGAGLVVLILRKIKRLPRTLVYILWVIPFIRFWMFFGIASQYSLLSFVSKYTTKTVVIWKEYPDLTLSNSLMAADQYFPITYKTDLLQNFFEIAAMIWIVIAVAALIAVTLLYFFTKTELKSASLIRDNLYKSEKITAPAVYGMMHPRIIIPTSMAEIDLKYIILHEQVHIKRKDNLLRVLAIVTACVHWFNPLSWVFLKTFFCDMELACDGKVIKSLDDKKAKDYAAVILACASGKTLFASAFGGAKTRIRIENICSYKKLTTLSFLSLIIFMIALFIVLITNASL